MDRLENTASHSTTGLDPGYKSLKEGAAVVHRPGRTLLRLAGKKPLEMLNAVLTNRVPEEENLGVYAALLNPKGRIQADLRVLKAGEDVLVDTESEGAGAARDILGRYAPFSRVELEDLSSPWGVLGLYGPRAADLLGGPVLAEHESARVRVGGADVLAAGVAVPVPGFDLVGPTGVLNAARESLLRDGAEPAGIEAYETARVEAGVPRFGSDLTPDNFPGESSSFLARAIDFAKGCYPGQETVARMHYRGSPNKKLYRFELEENTAEPGHGILQGEDVVGRLSSVAPLPVGGRSFALGYLSRKAHPEAPLRVEGAQVIASRPA